MTHTSLNLLLIGILLALTSCTDNRIRTSFFTQGGCEDCQRYIEEILSSQKGVDSVSWNYQTSMTEVVFDTTRISEDELQQILSKNGFSTTFFEADTSRQKDLPECCTQSVNRSLLTPGGVHGH